MITNIRLPHLRRFEVAATWDCPRDTALASLREARSSYRAHSVLGILMVLLCVVIGYHTTSKVGLAIDMVVTLGWLLYTSGSLDMLTTVQILYRNLASQEQEV